MRFFLVLIASLAFITSSSISAQDKAISAPGEIVLRLRTQTTKSHDKIRAQAKKLGKEIEVTRYPNLRMQKVKVPEGMLADALKAYREDPNVVVAEPNYVVKKSLVPVDPGFSAQWALTKIRAPQAWDIETGSPATVVAVLDTGIDYVHQDLSQNMWNNPEEISGNDLDDDFNGYTDDVYGWDFAYSDSNPTDGDGHGTHVSGIIGAVGDNGIGTAGVNWRVQLMAVKILDNDGSGFLSDVINGIDYVIAAKNQGVNVHVMNASFSLSSYSESLRLAVADAGVAGITMVAAAGNDSGNYASYPAGFALDNVISVASTTTDDSLSWFSNYHSVTVDVGAPGSGIYSTVPGDQYDTYDGTSMAAPQVSGLAALILSAGLANNVASLRARIFNTVDKIPALNGKVATGGRINAERALSPGFISPSAPTVAIGGASRTFQLMGGSVASVWSLENSAFGFMNPVLGELTAIAVGQTRARVQDNLGNIIYSSNVSFVGLSEIAEASGIIGAGGGTVEAHPGTEIERAKIEISPGTLSSATEITVAQATTPPAFPGQLNAVGPAFVFGPAGMELPSAAVITLPYTDELLDSAGVDAVSELDIYYFDFTNSQWVLMPESWYGVDTFNQFFSFNDRFLTIYQFVANSNGGGGGTPPGNGTPPQTPPPGGGGGGGGGGCGTLQVINGSRDSKHEGPANFALMMVIAAAAWQTAKRYRVPRAKAVLH